MHHPSWLEVIPKVFTNATPEAWAVILLIILPLTCWTLCQLWRAWHDLGQELSLLERCRREVQATPYLSVASDVDNLLRDARAGGLVARAVCCFWSTRLLGSANTEAILTMLEQAEARRLGNSRGIPNRLLLAGLLGTVLGLAGAVASLGPQIQGTIQTADPLILTRNLGATLQYMQSAFAATAWGILTAITVTIASSRVEAKQALLLTELQEFSLRDLVPRVTLSGQQAQLDDIRRIVQQGHDFMKQVSELMSDASGRLGHLVNSAATELSVSTRRLEAVATGIEGNLSEVAADVLDSGKELRSSASQLQRVYALVDETHRKLGTQSSEHLQELVNLQQAFREAASRILEINEESVKSTNEKYRTIFEGMVNSNSSVATRIDSGFSALNAALVEHREGTRTVAVELGRVTAQLETLTTRLDPRLLPKEEWAAVRDTLRALVLELQRAGVAAGAPTQQLGPLRTLPGLDYAELRDTLQRMDPRSDLEDIKALLRQLNLLIGGRRPQSPTLSPNSQPTMGGASPGSSSPTMSTQTQSGPDTPHGHHSTDRAPVASGTPSLDHSASRSGVKRDTAAPAETPSRLDKFKKLFTRK